MKKSQQIVGQPPERFRHLGFPRLSLGSVAQAVESKLGGCLSLAPLPWFVQIRTLGESS